MRTHRADVIDQGSASDSDAPEEESNVTSRKQVKATEQKRDEERKRKAEERRKRAMDKQELSEKRKSEKGVLKTEAANEAPKRLDPSLFAASFSQPAIASSSRPDHPSASTSASQAERIRQENEAKRKAKRKGGIVQGLDGRPMRRLNDGQTVVRVLDPAKASGEDDQAPQTNEETLAAPVASLPTSQMLPSGKTLKFKRQKLGLNAKMPPQQAKTNATAKRSAKTAEDPLGLEDPAFMQGGELAHLGMSAVRGKKRPSPFKQTGRAAKGASSLRRGDAGRRSNASNGRHAVASNFARSQMP